MKAVVQSGFGGAEVLRVAEVEKPVATQDRVLIRVVATSVNRPDIVQRQGNYPPPKGESEILGLEVAGVIEEVGPQAGGFEPGERVMALVAGGGYAEYALAYSGHVIRIPASMTFEQAACVCETYITAYLNVFRIGELENGNTVLLHGGGGGVNTAALQLCKALTPDALVIVTASAGKLERVKALGADVVIDYRNEDFAEVVRARTQDRGADVILDHIGGPYLASNLKALAIGGRLLIIGVMGGPKAQVNLAGMMVRRQRIIGSVLRSRPIAEKTAIIGEFERVVMPLFASQRITPLIDRIYPIEQVGDAHRAMEAGEHFGKIVLAL